MEKNGIYDDFLTKLPKLCLQHGLLHCLNIIGYHRYALPAILGNELHNRAANNHAIRQFCHLLCLLGGGDAKPNGAGHITRPLCQCNNLGEVLFVSESGIKTPEDIQKLYDNGTNAVLIKEDEAYIAALREKIHVPIIQAFKVSCPEDVANAQQSSADYILLDNGSGGTGKTFDWSHLRDITRPYILAGGLGPDNLGLAVSQLVPWGVDLSSGVETDGFKDNNKVLAAVQAVRATL